LEIISWTFHCSFFFLAMAEAEQRWLYLLHIIRTVQFLPSLCILPLLARLFVVINIYKKTWPAGGKTAPGYCIKRRPSHAGQENPRTPAPSLHSGTVAHVRRPRPGPGLRPVLWPWDRRGDFFNLSLKFAPTGSRTQDLRSAAGFL
jgi:hypothetical protein